MRHAGRLGMPGRKRGGGGTGEDGEISVSALNLQRLVTREEMERMRELRRRGMSIRRIAYLLGRSPTTIIHYLKSD